MPCQISSSGWSREGGGWLTTGSKRALSSTGGKRESWIYRLFHLQLNPRGSRDWVWHCAEHPFKGADNINCDKNIDITIKKNDIIFTLLALTFALSWTSVSVWFLPPHVLAHNKKGLQNLPMISPYCNAPTFLHHFHNSQDSQEVMSSFCGKASLVKSQSSFHLRCFPPHWKFYLAVQNPLQHKKYSQVCLSESIHFPVLYFCPFCAVYQANANSSTL